MSTKLNGHKIINGTSLDPSKIVAYFDFDGTLTSHDTLIPFVMCVSGIFKFIIHLPFLLYILILYFFRIINNEKAKELFLTKMIKKVDKERIESVAKYFAYKKLDKYIKPEIYSRLEYHLEHKHHIILVSANLAIYLRHWAKKHHLDGVIATELEFDKNNLATGKLATRNCYADEKTKRINEYLVTNNISYVYSYGYGNSAGDYSLLRYVDEGCWVSGSEIISWLEYHGSRSR